jgi:hypothetical protein
MNNATAKQKQCDTIDGNGIERCALDEGHKGPCRSPWGRIAADQRPAGTLSLSGGIRDEPKKRLE